MTTTGIEVRVRAGHERAEVTRFTKTINEVVLSLREIDRVYLERATRATWVIADLSNQSGDMRVRLEARPHSMKRELRDMVVPADALVNGAVQLARVAEVPKLYMPNTVRRLAGIATLQGGVQGVSVATYNGRVGTTVELTQAVREHAEQAVQGRERSYGSFAGVLDLISKRRNQRGLKISMYDRASRRAIDGNAPESMEEQIRELFGHRVLAGGIVTRNERGQAIRIEMKRLEQIENGASGRPSTDELLGIAPDWLGNLSVDEYIAGVRGA
uniref:hypothetical protein n=1 Tax=Rhodococcus qingshengii TaxID=334542 RepID=UPI001C4E21FA|nr:hypothetical protein [Rhodococcus qingshengii]